MSRIFIFLLFVCAMFLGQEIKALPPDLAPPGPTFGDASRDGTLVSSASIGEADFGGGLRLPVRFLFQTGWNWGEWGHYGWKGFTVPVIQAAAIKTSSGIYKVGFLCGKLTYLSKVPSSNPPQWKSSDGEWTGVEENNGHRFVLIRWDGWKLTFDDGRLKELKTDDGRTLKWDYHSTYGYLVTRIYEPNGITAFEVDLSNDPILTQGSSYSSLVAIAFIINGERYTLKYANGTISEVEYPDGRKQQWQFQTTYYQNTTNPRYKRLTYINPDGFWKSWLYNADPSFSNYGRLITDDVWNYAFTGGYPAADGLVYDRPEMARTRIATEEIEKLKFESENSLKISTDALGNIKRTYSYETPGRIHNKVYKIERKRPGESEFTVIWRGVYNAETGDLVSSYDAQNHQTTYVYERFSGTNGIFLPPQKVTTTDPLGRVSVVERNDSGLVVETIDPAGVKHKFEWDPRRRLTKIKNATNDVLARFVYGEKDQIVERYDAYNNKTSYDYLIHLGRPLLKKITTPEGAETAIDYNSKGRVSKITDPADSEWNLTYSGTIGLADKITDPLDGETEVEFDARLNAVSITDPLEHTTGMVYDDLNLPKEITDALGQIVKLKWNALSSVKELTDPKNNVYHLTWESASARKKLEWPTAVKQEMVYDTEGRVTTYKPRGTDATVAFTYNDAGELSGQSWTFGSSSGSNSVTRNSYGQIIGTSATSLSTTVDQTLGYDAQGRIASLSQAVGGVTRSASSITYDLNGRLKTITYPVGFTITYEYTSDGQIEAIKKGTDILASYAYDTAGRLNTRTLLNGVVTTYTYDAMSRIIQISVDKGSTTLWAERYGYDGAGRRMHTLSGTTGNVGDAYWLDQIAQLRGVKYGATNAHDGYSSASSPAFTTTWQYDAAGNRTDEQRTPGGLYGTTPYATNSVNQYTQVGFQDRVYNSRGDLSSLPIVGPFPPGETYPTFKYDAFGNLQRLQDGAMIATFWQDASARRAVKDINGAKIIYFNLGLNQLEAYTVSSSSALSYIYEPGIDRPLVQISSNGDTHYFHQDILGSVRVLTNVSGTAYQSYNYSVWGAVKGYDAGGNAISADQIASKWLFTGREFDKETALYHFRARDYDPSVGRFLQNDPIDFSGGDFNLYRYVYNDPMNWIDPTGRQACGCPVTIADAYRNSEYGKMASQLNAWNNMANSINQVPNAVNPYYMTPAGQIGVGAVRMTSGGNAMVVGYGLAIGGSGLLSGVGVGLVGYGMFNLQGGSQMMTNGLMGYSGAPLPGMPVFQIPPNPNSPNSSYCY